MLGGNFQKQNHVVKHFTTISNGSKIISLDSMIMQRKEDELLV